ncbi:MlaD family protein [Nocardia sp. NPDC055029]
MNIRTGLSMGGMATIAVASVLYMNHLGLGFTIAEPHRTATMRVADTNGLTIGSKVLLRGTEIGAIQQMELTASGVDIVWNYRDVYQIPVHSQFRIDTLSALGEAYLAVLPTTEEGPFLADAALIPTEDVTVPATIQDLSARLTRLLDEIHPDQIREIFRELNTALPDDGLVLVDLSRAWTLFADMAELRAVDLTTVLSKFQALLADSAWIPGDLDGTAAIIRPFGDGLAGWLNTSSRTTYVALFPEGIAEGTGPFLDNLQQFLDKVAPDLRVLGVAVLPSVRAAAAAMQTVDIARLLDQAIADSADGSVTVHVGVP